MTSKTQTEATRTKALPRASRTSAKAASGGTTMFMVKGDADLTLGGIRLPAGAELAIVSSNPDVKKTIRRDFKERLVAVRSIDTSPAVPKTKDARPLVNQDAFKPDARSQALLEGIRIAQEDLREAGGAYDLEQVRALMLGISRQAVDKRVQEGSLLAVPGPSNRRSYPTLQFNQDGSIVDGLKSVRDALPTSNPWAVLNFLINPDDRLDGRKPIDVLKSGQVRLVIEAARRLGQQGA